MKKTLMILSFFPVLTWAHGGGLDKNGGHNGPNGYHCHQEPCSSQFEAADKALSEAVEEDRPFSYVYRREDWKHWSDFDNDCMNTRHEILKDQADGPIKISPDGCYVSSGVWNDPFSGKQYTRASDLDVGHIVPLKWANDHGGDKWSAEMKEQFANDPVNLLVVDDSLNQSKGAKGPSEWMPPNQNYRCEYLRMWINVLEKYVELSMFVSEKRIFERQIEACGAH